MPKIIAEKPAAGKPQKPHKDFPLFAHQSGQWAKKIRGRHYYFGPLADADAALAKWLNQKDDLLAGRTPRIAGDGLTIRDLVNRFLTTKQQSVETREITQRHFDNLHATCEILVGAFGRNRLVSDLTTDDFEALRASLAKTRKAWALGGQIQKIRSVLKYGYECGVIDRPVRFGPAFKVPGKAAIRRERSEFGPRLFEAADLRKIINAAGQPLKAMILLGLNCGYGNTDLGTLPKSALDLKAGWASHPRPKTGIDRRCPLWPETIAAVREAIAQRPEPMNQADNRLVFITKYGTPWAKERTSGPLSAEFRKLLVELGIRRKGINFYTLRHVFATIGGASRDQVAVNFIMGHSDPSMAGFYREQIDDNRLQAVTDHVRHWLWPPAPTRRKRAANPKPKPAAKRKLKAK